MGTANLDSLNEELDSLAIRLLRLMKEYIDVKLVLQEFIKAGSLHLAKSRYIMGNKSVSVLQLPSEESSEFVASTRIVVNNEEDDLSFQLSKVSLKDIKDSGHEVMSRHRRNKDKDDNDKESTTEEDDDSKKIVIPDPLKWFGVLVPQNMRQAQWNFNKALEYSIQCANIQLEIETVRKNYKLRSKEKDELNLVKHEL